MVQTVATLVGLWRCVRLRCMICVCVAYSSLNPLIRTLNPADPEGNLNWVNATLCALCWNTAVICFRYELNGSGKCSHHKDFVIVRI